MADPNAPKSPDAKRDGVTTNAQSGTGTGASGSPSAIPPAGTPSGATASSGEATPITSPSQPAGSPPGTGDAGSERNLKQSEESKANEIKTQRAEENQKAKDSEEVDKETGLVTRTIERKDGSTVTVSSVSSEEADKHVASLDTLQGGTGPVNMTENLTGSPGNVNLTQDGRLAGDKSLRDDRTVEEINEEINTKVPEGTPNPTPNRDGNELTRMGNMPLAQTLRGIDRDTTQLGKELRELSKKNTLSEEDRDRLESISRQLDTTARI